MRTISWGYTPRSRNDVLHIETPLGIINVRAGLEDRHYREVVSIEILADASMRDDRKKIRLYGVVNNRLVLLKKKVR